MNVMPFRQARAAGRRKSANWTNQDLAEFYRVIGVLEQAGLSTEVDSGITDEGDPWFVFVRPDNGDVIAHFARIDSQLVAVSSFNKEVYRGSDMRAIVDQMLNRHPMLLPQNNNGPRISLHPTAALTAFVAAAFILSIDNVQAGTLTDVIVAAASKGPISVNSENTVDELVSRVESLRGITAEVGSANYNLVAIGAALIAHELWGDDYTEFNRQLELSEFWDVDGALNQISLENESAELGFSGIVDNSSSGHERGSLGGNLDLQAQEEGPVKNLAGETKFESEQNSIFTNKDDQIIVSEEFAGGIPVREVSWAGQNFIFEEGAVLYSHEGELRGKKGFSEPQTIDFGGEAGSLASIVENAYEAFGKVSQRLFDSGMGGADSLGIAHGSFGELFVFSVDGFKGKTGPLLSDLILVTDQKVSLQVENPPDTDATLIKSVGVSHSTGTLLESQTGATEIGLPIIGHSLSNSDNSTAELSEAIDVVFYGGGQASVINFELGKDLLWFFLTPEELAKSESRIDTSGNLILEFGEIGTLTFLDVLDETTFSQLL